LPPRAGTLHGRPRDYGMKVDTRTPRATGDDAALVEAARSGDRAALAELLGRHRAVLLALCRRALGDATLAEDAAQEAALTAMLGLDRLRSPASFGAWLAGIGLNICRRWSARPAPWAWETLVGGVSTPGAWEVGLDPADQAIASEVARRVRRAVRELPDGQRRAVTLRYFAGMTQAEMAAALDIPVGAVKTRLHKGRAALRDRLRGLWRDDMVASSAQSGAAMEVRRVLRTRGQEQPWRHVVVLGEVGGERILPIWIGQPEATWLALAMERTDLPRPGTYALMARTIEAMGGRLAEVRISRLADQVFYAELVCEDRRGARHAVDARPSDALNLAVILDAPILASPEVMEVAGAGPLAERVREALGAPSAEVEDVAEELTTEARRQWASMRVPCGPPTREGDPTDRG
jgi:RNA polymerase sigma factor (sigma-70 family)